MYPNFPKCSVTHSHIHTEMFGYLTPYEPSRVNGTETMKILIACEESGRVTQAFREQNHEAFSCDLIETSGMFPEFHIKDDVRNHLVGWDMIIGFPPCDHLASSGARWFPEKRKDGRQQQGIDLFMALVNAPCEKICIENPVGIMSTVYRKPDQIIQPWMFGEEAQKTTCLWLKNLPKLVPTKIVSKGAMRIYPDGTKYPLWISDAKHSKQANRSQIRGKTFVGVANAMSLQWGEQ